MDSWLQFPWLQFPRFSTARNILYGFIFGFSLSLTCSSITVYYQARRRQRLASQFKSDRIHLRDAGIISGLAGLIGWSHQMYTHIFIHLPEIREHALGPHKLTE